MKTENFKRAKEIEKEIGYITCHVNYVKGILFMNGVINKNVSLKISDGNTTEKLREPMMALPLKEFLGIYLSRCEQMVKDLEKEFESL